MISHESQPGNGSSAGPACGSGKSSSRFSSSDSAAASDVNPLEPVLKHLAELREYAAYYLSTSADGVKLSLRTAAIKAGLGVVGLIAAAAIVVTAAVLLLSGIANGLAVLMGDRLWAGQLTTGVLVLAAIAAGVYFGVNGMTKSSRQKTIEKYERRQQQQRAAFGKDVHQRAEQQAR